MFYSHIALVLMTAHYYYSVRQTDTFNHCLHLFNSSLSLYKHLFNRHSFYLQLDLFLTGSVDETICPCSVQSLAFCVIFSGPKVLLRKRARI